MAVLKTRSHPEMVGDKLRVTLNQCPYCLRPLIHCTLKVVCLRQVCLRSKVLVIFFPAITSIINSFCAFLARVKTYTHTKNYTAAITGSHLRAVTDVDDDDDADNAGRHSTITRET